MGYQEIKAGWAFPLTHDFILEWVITVANLLWTVIIVDDFKIGMFVYTVCLVWSDEHCCVIALL
jgi:hypothetical protein